MTDTGGTPVETPGTADVRRQQMLRAALDVISERGYPDTRIADVAERSGISPALVIYYFQTKDRLLTEAIRFSEESWYSAAQQRLASLPTDAARIEAVVAMICIPEEDPEQHSSWPVWLDFWAQAARNAEVAIVRQRADERWRDTIGSLVRDGLESGEFRDVNAADFAVLLSSLLNGLAIQIALKDPVVDAAGAFEVSMRFAAGALGFDWAPGRPRVLD